MYVLGNSIFQASKSMGLLSLLTLLFIFISSILGMHLMGDRFRQPYLDMDPAPRSNFDSFGQAVLTVFQVTLYIQISVHHNLVCR